MRRSHLVVLAVALVGVLLAAPVAGGAFSGKKAKRWTREIADIGARVAGGENERRAGRMVRTRLDALGYETERLRFALPNGGSEESALANESAMYTPAGTHNPTNVGTGAVDALLIEFKTAAPGTAALPASRPGMDVKVLHEAGIEDADAVVVATNGDNTSIVVGQVAQKRYGIDCTVVRILDPARAEVYATLGLRVVCPTSSAIDVLTEAVKSCAIRPEGRITAG